MHFYRKLFYLARCQAQNLLLISPLWTSVCLVVFPPFRLHRQLPFLLLLLPIKFTLHRSHVPTSLWKLFLHWLFIFIIFRPKTESFWNRQLLCPRARSLRSQAPWRLHEDHEKAPTTTAAAPGFPAVLWELCFLTESLFSYRYPSLCECSGLSGNTWFVLLRLHAQWLGFQTSSSYSSSAPLCSSLSVSIVVTARCYVQTFCPPLHLPSSRASSLSSLCITATPEPWKLPPWDFVQGELSLANKPLLQGILLGFSRYIMYDLCTMYRQSFIYFLKRKPFLDKGMMVA